MKKGISYYRKVFDWNRQYKLPEHDVTIETENGLLSCSNKDWLIGKHLFVHRNYEIDFIKNAIEFLQSEDLLKKGANNTVVDVGANIGMICIALLLKGYFKNAIAFEPTPENFRLLQKNVGQNDLSDKVKCFNFALSSDDKQLEFELSIGNSGDNRIKLSDDRGKMNERQRKTIRIAAKKFDSVLSENQDLRTDEIDLLWLDIQGHEGHFFQGATDFLNRRKIPCISEFWGYGIKRAGMTQTEYCKTVSRIYTKFYHYDKGVFRLREISEIEDLFQTDENPRRIASVIFV